MRSGARSGSAWRVAVGALAGCAMAAASAGVEAALGAPAGARLGALALGAGLAAPTGLAVGLASIAGLALLLGADPLRAWEARRREWRGSKDAAALFACRAVALGLAAIAWAAAAAHAVRIGRQAFHHMGLAALLAVAGLIAAGAALGLIAAAAARFAAPRLARRLPARALAAAAPLSLLSLPACAALLLAAAPPGGAGAFGHLGLLKRDEVELAFLWPLAVAGCAAAAAFALPGRRAAPALAVAVFLAGGASLACASAAASPRPAELAALAALDAEGGLPSASLGLFRRAADRDRDGASSLFGGGDCDDRDPAISPSAIDVPGNGVDEDCSGTDATRAVAAAPPADAPREAAASGQVAPGLSLLLLTVDALRADACAAGRAPPVCPGIDALAARGVVFERAYALSSFTGRAIGPMLAGRHPSETYCDTGHFTRYGPGNGMLAEALKAAGFATAGVHGHFYFGKGGLDQGFDRWVVVDPPGAANADQKTTGREIADAAIAILRDRAFTEGRFFLWAHFMDPHKEYLEHDGFSVYGTRARERYDGEVAFSDFQLGRVVAALGEGGLAGRTAIVVTGDHGEAFKEHDILFHGRRLWEEVVRVPWIWVVPGLAPRRIAARVSHVDLAPTVVDLLGAGRLAGATGRSLVPHMTGAASEDRRVYLDQPLGPYMPEAHAVIDGGKKLVHTAIGNRYELYDLDADPGETTDLAATDPAELARMKAVYQETRAALDLRADVYRP